MSGPRRKRRTRRYCRSDEFVYEIVDPFLALAQIGRGELDDCQARIMALLLLETGRFCHGITIDELLETAPTVARFYDALTADGVSTDPEARSRALRDLLEYL